MQPPLSREDKCLFVLVGGSVLLAVLTLPTYWMNTVNFLPGGNNLGKVSPVYEVLSQNEGTLWNSCKVRNVNTGQEYQVRSLHHLPPRFTVKTIGAPRRFPITGVLKAV